MASNLVTPSAVATSASWVSHCYSGQAEVCGFSRADDENPPEFQLTILVMVWQHLHSLLR
ncbi:hypothetical protein P3L10_026104 [Capsicum annuum]